MATNATFKYHFHQILTFNFLLTIFTFLVSSTHSKTVGLRALRRHVQSEPKIAAMDSEILSSSDKISTFYYTQKLDHFNFKPESYATFDQRYVINFKYWSGPKTRAPIVVFFGAEEDIDDDIDDIGFLNDITSHFKGLLVYIEHRYYGKSTPFGSKTEAFKNGSSLGYLNSVQAIADYAAVILHVKQTYFSKTSPVIVVGGSYGGMLASWFRLKYPHVALGALASSAPILYFDDIAPRNGYYSIVTKDFKETSESCSKTIRKSWAEIKRVASTPDGLSILSKKFRTCKPLKTSFELEDYLDSIYTEAAQYNDPPAYPVTVVCGGLDGAPRGTDLLGRIFAGLVAYRGNISCFDMNEYSHNDHNSLAWGWQTCSELVMPIGHDRNTMFTPSPFNLSNYIKECKGLFDVLPQPHWVTTYYGGHDLKLILHSFASNIIFSNGLRDPYSSGGVLENISDSIIAVSTVNGSHCLDIHQAQPTDPEWLVNQRKTEIEVIEGWISKYYADLDALKDETNKF